MSDEAPAHKTPIKEVENPAVAEDATDNVTLTSDVVMPRSVADRVRASHEDEEDKEDDEEGHYEIESGDDDDIEVVEPTKPKDKGKSASKAKGKGKGSPKSTRTSIESDEESESDDESSSESEDESEDDDSKKKKKAKAKKTPAKADKGSDDDSSDSSDSDSDDDDETSSSDSNSDTSSDSGSDDEDSRRKSKSKLRSKSKKSSKSNSISLGTIMDYINDNMDSTTVVTQNMAANSVRVFEKSWYNKSEDGSTPIRSIICTKKDAKSIKAKLVPHKPNVNQGTDNDANKKSDTGLFFRSYSFAVSPDAGKTFTIHKDIQVGTIIVPPSYPHEVKELGKAGKGDKARNYFSVGFGYDAEFIEWVHKEIKGLEGGAESVTKFEYALTNTEAVLMRKAKLKKTGQEMLKKTSVDRVEVALKNHSYNVPTGKSSGVAGGDIEVNAECYIADDYMKKFYAKTKSSPGDGKSHHLSAVADACQKSDSKSKKKYCIYGPGTVNVAVTYTYEVISTGGSKSLYEDDEIKGDIDGDGVYVKNGKQVRVTMYEVRITPKSMIVVGRFPGEITQFRRVTKMSGITIADSDDEFEGDDDEEKTKEVKSKKAAKKSKKNSKEESEDEDEAPKKSKKKSDATKSKKSKKLKYESSDEEDDSNDEESEEEVEEKKPSKKSGKKSKLSFDETASKGKSSSDGKAKKKATSKKVKKSKE